MAHFLGWQLFGFTLTLSQAEAVRSSEADSWWNGRFAAARFLIGGQLQLCC